MDLQQIIAALSKPGAYLSPVRDVPVGNIEVRQTHISVVFLTGEYVYKIKKPVKLPFLDFSSLAKRKQDCDEEVRLNARLAPGVYLGVVPIVERAGEIRIASEGKPVEWAVQMRRLPDHATLESYLQRGAVTAAHLSSLIDTIAEFHKQAERSPRISNFASWESVSANAQENFVEARGQLDEIIHLDVLTRLKLLTEERLARLRPLFESRAKRHVPCDTHGDLRIDHVYFLDGAEDQGLRTVVLDCIEFNEAYRFADPVSDIAFLVMDLKSVGQHRLANELAAAYFTAMDDEEGRQLLPFYTSYRAAVRGKVEGLKQAEAEVPPADRDRARLRARGYWLLALSELEAPARRPALLLLGGLPGSGKSTLAANLAKLGDATVLRTDLIRKELACEAQTTGAQSFGTGIYSAEWNARTYAECLARAERLLYAGKRVIVDASFREDAQRQAFAESAARLCLPAVFLHCQADSQTIRHRLSQRQGDASDADWSIYQAAANAWEPASDAIASITHSIDSGASKEHVLEAALAVLAAENLWESGVPGQGR